MNKIKTAIVILLAAIVVFVGVGVPAMVFADTVPVATAETIDPDISSDESEKSDIEGIAADFVKYLKTKYGEEYEYYYNQIIERWGSVEAYLLSLGDKLPEEYQSGWQKFISWLGEYSVIWAPAIAVILVICAVVIGKKQFNKIIERAVNSKLSPIITELNKQSNATIAILHANKALLGSNEKFSEAVKELNESEKELANE